MSHPLTAELPSDEAALASMAGDLKLSREQRQQAFERLLGTIRWVAGRLSIRFSGSYREDAIEDAPGDIWAVIDRYPAGGDFEAWCYSVLRNRWLETVRRDDRRQARERHPRDLEVTDATVRKAIEHAIDATEGFRDADVAVIAGWPHRDRLVLLCLAGLWQKVPGRQWKTWVAEHREQYGNPDDPFPPEVLAACEQIAARNAVLAVALNLRRNTLSVLLYRGKHRLADLQYVRDCFDPPVGGSG